MVDPLEPDVDEDDDDDEDDAEDWPFEPDDDEDDDEEVSPDEDEDEDDRSPGPPTHAATVVAAPKNASAARERGRFVAARSWGMGDDVPPVSAPQNGHEESPSRT